MALQRADSNPTHALRLAEKALDIYPENKMSFRLIHDLVSDSTKLFYKLNGKSEMIKFFEPGGKLFFIKCSQKGKVDILSDELKLIKSYKLPINNINSFDIFPNNKFILISYGNNRIAVYDIDGKLLMNLKMEDEILNFTITSDNKYICVADKNGNIKVVNIKGKVLKHIHIAGHIDSIYLSNNQSFFLTVFENNESKLYDFNGMIIRSFAKEFIDNFATAIAWDNSLIATSDYYGYCKIFKPQGKHIQRFRAHDLSLRGIIFCNDNNHIITYSENSPVIKYTIKGNALNLLPTKDDIWKVVLSSTDQYVLTLGSSGFKLWDYEKQVLCKNIKAHGRGIGDVVFSPNSKTLLSSDDFGKVKLWNLSGDLIISFKEKLAAGRFVFSNDGLYVMANDEDFNMALWKSDGKLISRFRAAKGIVSTAFISPDSQYLIAGCEDGKIRIWGMDGKLIKCIEVAKDGPISISHSMVGNYFLSGDQYGIIKLWDTKLDQNLWEYNISYTGNNTVYIFSDNDHFLALLNSGVFLCESKGKIIASFLDDFDCVFVSPSGKLALLCRLSGKATLIDKDGKIICEFEGNGSFATRICFTPDDKYILYVEYQSTATLWNTQGELVQSFNNTSLWSANLSPDGNFVATGDQEGNLKIFSTKPSLLSSKAIAQLTKDEKRQYGISNKWYKAIAK